MNGTSGQSTSSPAVEPAKSGKKWILWAVFVAVALAVFGLVIYYINLPSPAEEEIGAPVLSAEENELSGLSAELQVETSELEGLDKELGDIGKELAP